MKQDRPAPLWGGAVINGDFMKVIFENNLSNSQIIEYIEKYTKDERKRSFLKDRIIKGATYDELGYFYPEWVNLYFNKMKHIISNFEKWLTKAVKL